MIDIEAEFLSLPVPPPGCLAFLRKAGIQQDTLIARIVKVAPVEFLQNRRFEFSTAGDAEPAFVLTVNDAVERPFDMCAWPVHRPNNWATYLGPVAVLGEAALFNASSYFGDAALPATKTPLGWLRHAGRAVCPLDPDLAWERLRRCPRLAADNERHGHELRRLLQPPEPQTQILIPREERIAA